VETTTPALRSGGRFRSLTIALICLALTACVSSPTVSVQPAPSFDDISPRFSPDGARIVFVRKQADDSDIYVIDVAHRAMHRLVDVSDYDLDPAFSPDGSQVLFDSSPDDFPQLHLVPADGGDVEPISEVLDGWATFPAWSPDGDMIVYSCGRPSYDASDLCVLTPDGRFIGLLEKESSSQELEPSWSPDGTTVAFASNRFGDQDAFLIDVKSGLTTRLTEDPAHDGDPAWSPDGSTIAFTSDRGGSNHVCLMTREGLDVRCIVEGVQPSWSPDGAMLAFYRETPSGSRVFVAKVDGTGVEQIT
jgi:TolB protein